MIGLRILNAVNACFYVFYLIILIRCLMSFLPLNYNNANNIIKSFVQAVDMYLNIFRRFIPPVGMFDFSPIVAFFALMILRFVVLNVLAFIFSIVGII